MSQKQAKKIQTDVDVKRKAVKQVVLHIKKKITSEYLGSEYIKEWLLKIDEILAKEDFDIKEYIKARKELNDIIERTMDEQMRFKLRDSWFSFGRALEKKVKVN
ncbi:hypothetical protein [Ruminiclostridium josui]|uniref:hypothetical protein n=1 Tax=Ruminiclostridium josui TaxID=1499 RepID=UPI000464FB17|nr:hypothetical protein [Ruminiclostridium josui]